jgi:hypothetical protein
MQFRLGIICLLFLCTQGPASEGQDFTSFIGTDACRSELRGNGTEFGLALDRKQRAFVEVRQLNGKPAAIVVQYAKDDDRCGKVRDIVAAPSPKDVFEFECIDHTDVKRVATGIHQGSPGAKRWKASKAWVVDFDKLRLLPTNDSVTWLNYDYSGPDDGSDMRMRAAARAERKTP